MPDALKTSLIIILSQLPLAGGGWLWWTEKIQVQPLYAALAGGAYELSLFLVAFVGKVWKDELEKEAVKATGDWVRGVAHDLTPGFRRRYRKQVVQDYGIFNVRGLGLINTYTLKLDQVFVDLRIDPSSNPQRFNVDLIARKELTGNQPVWNFLRAGSGVQEGAALAIIGPPGCGKTTLLQHVAVTLAANRQRRHKVRAYTPVLLLLRDHVRKILQEQPPSLGRLVQDYLGDPQPFPTLRTPSGWFERKLDTGKCIILLDGLDEVADAEERRTVSAWVDAQIKNYPRCRFVITARPQGYADAPLQRAHVLEVQPFNAQQVRRFVENWYLANEIVASGGREDEGVRQRARKDAEDLLRRLRATQSLDALTVNPLLLTMIAMVHRYHGALPGSRVELYAEICEVLLGRWRQSRGVHDSLKTGQKLVVLRPLAAHMMESKIRDIATAEAASVIAEPLKLVGAAEAPETFLRNLQAGSGLLLERETGQWSFAHLTFQEYLTAAHWLEQKVTGCDWAALVGDSWWHETLRLYAAQGDATPLTRACLEVDTVPALALAADFLEESRQLLPEVRDAAAQRLVADLDSTDPARRRLAAEVRLTRRLRSLRHIDDEREIDLDFITCAEYQLFLDDARERGAYHQPDHWTAFHFAAGDARAPVAGVRAEDASAFCDWLTQRQGGGVRYRLPRPDEAQQYQAEASAFATWCGNQGDFSLSGLTPQDEQAIRRQLAGLSTLPLPSGLAIINDIHARDLALAFDRALDRDHARARNRARARDLDHALTLALDRARARARNRTLDLDLARDLDLDLDLARARARARALDRTLDRARVLVRDLARYGTFILALAHARAHARIILLILDPSGTALPDEPVASRQSAQGLMAFPADPAERREVLMNDLLAIADAQTLQAALLAQRKYVARLFAHAYLDSKEGERGFRLSLWRNWLPFRKGKPDTLRRDALEGYWRFRVIVARAEQGLPAWEGIRIVRESATGTLKGSSSS